MIRLPGIVTKFIYGLFILWIGVLAPLVYFDRFAAHHQVQPYRFALFEARARIGSLPSGAVESQLVQQLAQRFTRQQDSITASNPFFNLVHSLQQSRGWLYLLAVAANLLLLLLERLSLSKCSNMASADLPPPDKPPRVLSLSA